MSYSLEQVRQLVKSATAGECKCVFESQKTLICDLHHNMYLLEKNSRQIVPELVEKLERIQTFVNKQAKDDGLWFVAKYASEAYLQQELRKLHALIEREIL